MDCFAFYVFDCLSELQTGFGAVFFVALILQNRYSSLTPSSWLHLAEISFA